MLCEQPPADPREVARSLRELPPPSAEAQAVSEALIERIRAAIDAHGGRLRFDHYMAMCLYEPGLGYYSAGSRKFGEAGDFVTAPELSPLFSRCLARQCAAILDELGGGDILECGAGSGVMASDILLELEHLGQLPRRYAILELSADLRERQRETVAERAPHLLERVEWLEGEPQAFRGVVLGNELLDAMPVRRFRCSDAGNEELYVTWEGGRFALVAGAVEGEAMAGRTAELCQGLAPGFESEINFAAEGWVATLGGFLEAGVALLIDYGFPQREFYHPERSRGTLMCHYRHRAHDDALILPGLQDITTHVDFTAVADAALAAGLEVRGFANQANFLIANGLAELAAVAGEEEAVIRERMDLSAQVKRLTMPGEMGELFKVIALGRGLERPLQGFMLRDERGRL